MKQSQDEIAAWVGSHVLPHEAEVRARLRRVQLSNDEIDDMIQEAYCRIARLGSVAHITNGRAYLFQAARSVFLQGLQRRRIVRIDSVGARSGTSASGSGACWNSTSPAAGAGATRRSCCAGGWIPRWTPPSRSGPPTPLKARRPCGATQRTIEDVSVGAPRPVRVCSAKLLGGRRIWAWNVPVEDRSEAGMPRIHFDELSARPGGYHEAIVPRPSVVPTGYTTFLVTEWLTLNCRGEWSCGAGAKGMRLRFAVAEDHARAVARFLAHTDVVTGLGPSKQPGRPRPGLRPKARVAA